MITCYTTNINSFLLYYKDGTLIGISNVEDDKIIFDVMRKQIELYEDQLDLTKFRKIPYKKPKVFVL